METITIVGSAYYPIRKRKYPLFLNGSKVGSIVSGQRISLPVEPGRYVFEVKIDWFRSNPLDFDVTPGNNVVIEVGAKRVRPHEYFITFITLLVTNALGISVLGIPLGNGIGSGIGYLICCRFFFRLYARLITTA